MKKVLFICGLILATMNINAQTWEIGYPNTSDVTATLDNNTITISGVGTMRNFSPNETPWFDYLSSITTIIINNGVTSIGNYAFRADGAHTATLAIGSSVTTIGDGAFAGHEFTEAISYATVPPTLGNSAFTTQATGMNPTPNWRLRVPTEALPAYLTSIWNVFFVITDMEGNVHGTTGNLTWSINNGTLTISGIGEMLDYSGGGSPFNFGPWGRHPNSFNAIVIENGVTTIGDNAFRNLGLVSVTIPNTITTIGYGSFENNSNLTSVTIPSTVTTIGSSAFAGTGLTSVVIPENITTIEDRTFANTRLTSVVVPEGVTTIGASAFSNNTNLTSVTIPSTVTTIGERVFENNTALTTIVNHATTPQPIQVEHNVFLNVNRNTSTLWVPESSVEVYRTREVWRDFVNIKAINGNGGGPGDTDDLITILRDSISALRDSIDRLNDTITSRDNRITTLLGNISDLQGLNTTLRDSINLLFQLLADCEGTGTSNAPFIPTNQIQIYPNPVSYELRIINHEWEQDNVVELFDINGRRVFTGRGYGDVFTIDMSSFHPGNYVLRIGHRVARVVRQ